MNRSLGPSLFLILGCFAASADPLSVVAVSPFEELARALAQGAGETIETKTGDRREALRLLVGQKADLAILSGELLSGERKVLAAQPNYSPTIVSIGFETVKLIVHPESPLEWIGMDLARSVIGASDCIRPENESEEGSAPEPGRDRALFNTVYGPAMGSPGEELLTSTLLDRCRIRNDCIRYGSEAAIERAVAESTGSLGIVSRLRSVTKARVLSISKHETAQAAPPKPPEVASGEYPLARPILLLALRPSFGQRATSQLLEFALSRDGQREIARMGFTPLPTDD